MSVGEGASSRRIAPRPPPIWCLRSMSWLGVRRTSRRPTVREHEIRDLMSSGQNGLAIAMRDGALGIPWEMQRDFQRDASRPRTQLVIFSAKDPRASRIGSVTEDFKPVFDRAIDD